MTTTPFTKKNYQSNFQEPSYPFKKVGSHYDKMNRSRSWILFKNNNSKFLKTKLYLLYTLFLAVSFGKTRRWLLPSFENTSIAISYCSNIKIIVSVYEEIVQKICSKKLNFIWSSKSGYHKDSDSNISYFCFKFRQSFFFTENTNEKKT